MDPLNPRNKFINEETAYLFSNEKITITRNKVIECLNNVGLAESQAEKCENILKIQELLIFQEIDLLEEFIDDILALAHDTGAEVRKSIAAFIEKLCQKDITYLPKAVTVLSTLLRDESPQVVKRVIQGCSFVYKNTLKYLCDPTTDITDDLEQSWSKLCMIKSQILDMIDFENDGIRTNAIKFLEGVVIWQTSPGDEDDDEKKKGDFSLNSIPITLKLLKRRKLEDEAMNIFDLLLKFHGASHISSVNLIACTGTLCNIAKVRPALFTPVVEALKTLHANLPPTLTNSQVSTVRKHLKMQFLNLVKQPMDQTTQSEIIVILKDLGCNDSELKRCLPSRSKRPLVVEDMPSKRQRTLKQTPQSMESNEEAFIKATAANEAFLLSKLESVEKVIELVIAAMEHLPQEMPSNFLVDYTPIGEMTVSDQIKKTCNLIAKQMTTAKIGPGATYLTVSPPSPIIEDPITKADTKTDDSARQLKETLERMKGREQILKKKIKVPEKTLQDITKPLSTEAKESLLNQTVLRILKYNPDTKKNSLMQTKILAVIASTFGSNVKKIILDFIIEDFKSRNLIALDWLYSEYCLLSGFIRSPYTKTDQTKPDSSYNQLLIDILSSILSHDNLKEKQKFVQTIFLDAPLITQDALKILEQMCELEDMTECGLNIMTDLIFQTPSKNVLTLLLTLSMSRNNATRSVAVEKIIMVYDKVNGFKEHIEQKSIEQMNMVNESSPPSCLGEVWTENEVKICLALMLELLPHRHDLIEKLAELYIKVNADIKRTILRVIESPIKKMGPHSQSLISLIETCKPGSETLIIRIVYLLTELGPLGQDLIEKIRNLNRNKAVSDVRLLIPIINSLSKQEVLNILPSILKLNPVVIKEVFGRLLSVSSSPLPPVELLIALHTIDLTQIDLKFVVKASSLCLSESEVYTHDVLAVVLQQLSEMLPLPTLFMRTVIQSLSLHPRLSGFVINMLQRLVIKQIWKQQKVVWDGFIKCCQRLVPASLGVMIQLPAPQLDEALKLCPELRAPLLEYAKSITENQIGNVSEPIMNILKGKSCDNADDTNSDMLQSEPDPPGME
ncbi:symplekin [Culicoides brevitarsis]|uniref:symplekin n=1 Tax=Culicoides brevitarsis TaxID=469753 RepID=UPI00307C7C69